MPWISFTVHKRLQYSPSNCFSILLDTPRALTSHDFIVRAMYFFFYCLVIVVALLSRPFRAIFSLLTRSVQYLWFHAKIFVSNPLPTVALSATLVDSSYLIVQMPSW